MLSDWTNLPDPKDSLDLLKTEKMAEDEVDLLTIGAGGAGYPAAFRLAQVGMTAVMVDDKGVLSGNCLYEGCVPSKAVREMGDIVSTQQRLAAKGMMSKDTSIDFAAIMKHKDEVQNTRYGQHAEDMKKLKTLRLIKGKAKLTGPHSVEVTTDSGVQKFRCKHIIIGSGCDISVPPFTGSDLCLTSHDLYKPNPKLQTLPSRMIVIGGGYIGLETASFFASFGTNVTVLQRGPQLIKNYDPDLVSQLLPLLSPRIKLVTNCAISAVNKSGQSGYKVTGSISNKEQTFEADVVVVATGRRPAIPEGTKKLGIEVSKKGIVVGPDLQIPTHKHIYAVGDVNGHSPLFHSAVRQSLVAAHNILAGNKTVDYAEFSSVPNTIFTMPAAASVGITPSIAQEKGIEILKTRYDFVEDSRAQILDQMEGGIELFFEPGSLRLLGGWVVGIDAGLLIGQIGLAVANNLTAYELARFSDQHPMSSEGIGKAARSLF